FGLRAPVLEFCAREREGDSLLFACGQRDAFETFELADGTRCAACLLMDVELHDLVSSTIACVLDVDRDIHLSIGFHGWRAEFQVREGEVRVAESEAKGEERQAGVIPISRFEIGCGFGSLREVVRVIERRLPGGTRPGYREFSGGSAVARKRVGDSVAAFAARVPGFEYRGYARR